MNKRGLALAVSACVGCSRAVASRVVDAVFAAIADGLAHGRVVRVSGLGEFRAETKKSGRVVRFRPRAK